MTLTRAQQAASQFESSRGSHTLIFDFRFTIFDLSILRRYVLLVAALAKKILKDRPALTLKNAGGDFAMMVQRRMLKQIYHSRCRTAFRIHASENERANPDVGKCAWP